MKKTTQAERTARFEDTHGAPTGRGDTVARALGLVPVTERAPHNGARWVSTYRADDMAHAVAVGLWGGPVPEVLVTLALQVGEYAGGSFVDGDVKGARFDPRTFIGVVGSRGEVVEITNLSPLPSPALVEVFDEDEGDDEDAAAFSSYDHGEAYFDEIGRH